MSDLLTALQVAIRHLDDPRTTECEREAILITASKHFSGKAGETASRSLFHLREQRKLQLTLKNVVEVSR